MTLQELYRDVERSAAARNAEVVARAVSAIGCSDCDFPSNALDFFQTLKEYRDFKLTARRMRKSLEEGGPGNWSSVMKLSERATCARAYLSDIMPCPECRAKYNPTGRLGLPRPSYPKPEIRWRLLECLGSEQSTTR